ncbi:MAG: LysM peptidoglycan-binding domain-containing protein [Anaerolineales bacterium]|nr:LysM peptidoglycan-binding domain-containing protein [Chloroflexota bacterium]MBL6981342.1 LysM peptidoglycan-binding domain-containing protein [Anaerolineales bacterium]
MFPRRELILGLVTALASTLILAGSLVVAMAEDQATVAQIPVDTNTSTITPSPTITATPLPTQKPGEPTYTPSATPLPSDTPTNTNEAPSPTTCSHPSSWGAIIVQQGDTINNLAAKHNTSVDELIDANCLLVSQLLPGSTLYAPKLQPTPTFISCGPPAGWVYYTVKSGDNLYRIGLAHGVSVAQLQQANCLTSTNIRGGQQLYVPNVPTVAVSPTFTSTATMTTTATATSAATATATATSGGAPTATSTNTSAPPPTSTATTAPTETNTPVPTVTDTPVPTETATSIPSPTATP